MLPSLAFVRVVLRLAYEVNGRGIEDQVPWLDDITSISRELWKTGTMDHEHGLALLDLANLDSCPQSPEGLCEWLLSEYVSPLQETPPNVKQIALDKDEIEAARYRAMSLQVATCVSRLPNEEELPARVKTIVENMTAMMPDRRSCTATGT